MNTKLLTGLIAATIALPMAAPALAQTADANVPFCSAKVTDECMQRGQAEPVRAAHHLTRAQDRREDRRERIAKARMVRARHAVHAGRAHVKTVKTTVTRTGKVGAAPAKTKTTIETKTVTKS